MVFKKMNRKLRGTFTAVVTPFTKDGFIDFAALERFIDWQIQSGISGLVVCGSTGEAHTLTDEEYISIIEKSVKITNKRVPVIAGTGLNSTQKTIELTKAAQSAGVDFAMIVAPYYNKPAQDGIIEHFNVITKSVDIGIIVYNVPSRTSVDISDQTMASISSMKNIVGIKDATGDMFRIQNLRKIVKDDVSILSGDDSTSLAFNLYGGDGVISVISNLVPKKFSDMQVASLNGKFSEAKKLNDELFEITTAVSKAGTNPIPIKYALSLLVRYINEDVRLPLTTLSESSRKMIESAIETI